MTSSATVGGDERLRLFCALVLPEPVLDRLVEWQARELADGARVVPRDNLHITTAFLGHRPAGDRERVADAVRASAESVSGPIRLEPRSYRETRSVGMLVLADAEHRAAGLTDDLFRRLERLGVYERERRAWLPHLTVLRFRRPPRFRPALPDLGEFSPSGAAVYHSVLRPGGAQYEVLDFVALPAPGG